jgi:hypothetical protein
MSCRRACRELLWLTRFGEFGPSSAPHLEHLAGCRACRDEVGFDRAMVQQLRLALAVRVTNATPSESTWERILARAQTPEPSQPTGIWRWLASIAVRQRMATAMAGTGLALVLALNMEVVPPGMSASLETDAVSEPAAFEARPPVIPTVNLMNGFIGVSDASTGNPYLTEASVLIAAARPEPPVRTTFQAPEQFEEANILRIRFGSQASEATATQDTLADPEGETLAPAMSPPGQPS